VAFGAAARRTTASSPFDANFWRGRDKPVIFNYFDNPRSVRNNIDMMATYRAEHDDLAHIDLDVLVHTADGVYVHNASVKEGVSYPPRDRGLYYMKPEYRQFAIWFETLTHDPKPENPGKDSINRWLLGQAGVAAEMYVDHVRSAALADEFWGYVVRESHSGSRGSLRRATRRGSYRSSYRVESASTINGLNMRSAFIAGRNSPSDREPRGSSFHTACGVPGGMIIPWPRCNR
jgi:hypothetical protein